MVLKATEREKNSLLAPRSEKRLCKVDGFHITFHSTNIPLALKTLELRDLFFQDV